jgi:hypothetical protein
MIASWVQQLGWAKPATGPENTAAHLPVPKMPQAAPLAQVGAETVEQRLAAVRETVEQLAVGQGLTARSAGYAKLDAEVALCSNGAWSRCGAKVTRPR